MTVSTSCSTPSDVRSPDSVNSVTDIEKTITDRGFYAYSSQSTLESLKSVFLIIQGVLGALEEQLA